MSLNVFVIFFVFVVWFCGSGHVFVFVFVWTKVSLPRIDVIEIWLLWIYERVDIMVLDIAYFDKSIACQPQADFMHVPFIETSVML